MNIIQLQDDLKGLPDNALIGYVQNPTGAVPTYLALGELERRTKMREKFKQAAPTETVSEQIVQEAVPQGIGALMPTNMPPAMAAPMAPSPEAVTETGIANLPAPNVGQNYEAGGIVGYADGGGLVIDDTMATETFYNPLTGVDTLLEDDTETVSEEPEQPYNAAFTPEYGSAAVRGPLTMPAQLTQEQAIADMRKSEKEFGIDNSLESTYRSQKELDLAAMNEKRRTNFNMSLIAAGAAGLKSGSQFALSAMGSAIEGGLNNYIKTDKDLDAEEKTIKEAIFASKRAEQAEKKGNLKEAKAAVEERNNKILKVAEINLKYDADIQKALVSAGSAASDVYAKALELSNEKMKLLLGDSVFNKQMQNNKTLLNRTQKRLLLEALSVIQTGKYPVEDDLSAINAFPPAGSATTPPLTEEQQKIKAQFGS
jgi:hypothetical protein